MFCLKAARGKQGATNLLCSIIGGPESDKGAEPKCGHDHIPLSDAIGVEHPGMHVAKLGPILLRVNDPQGLTRRPGSLMDTLAFLKGQREHTAPRRELALVLSQVLFCNKREKGNVLKGSDLIRGEIRFIKLPSVKATFIPRVLDDGLQFFFL